MEEKIYFVGIGTGKQKDTGREYYYCEFVRKFSDFGKNCRTYFQSKDEFDNFYSKIKGKDLFLKPINALFGLDSYSKGYVKDIKF